MTVPYQPVLDPASGSRMSYFDKADDRVLFGDIRRETHTLSDGRILKVDPDQLMDFRALPFPDGTFQLVVFDPPHLTNAGETSWLRAKYGVLDRATWRDDLRAGFAECFRVLRPGGTLVFKWNETQVPVSAVLALTDERPVVGHRTAKSAATHWMLFLKDAEAEQ